LYPHPDYSLFSYTTLFRSQYIAKVYDDLSIPYETGGGGNGVVATLTGNKPGRTIALRADFDALPIQEENDVPYKSKHPGVMHACGHDGHTATLIAVGSVIKEYQLLLPGTVVFIHQHADDYALGVAKAMIEAGCLDGVEAVLGTHL